jgi:broad specificity phosphatase PhoE
VTGPGPSQRAGTVGAVTEMLLVRHGQSEWNAVGRWQGNADPALTELGRLQAMHAAGRVGAVDVIVASPLIRALETARLISSQIGVGPVVVDADLAERDAGEWEGLTRAEIEEGWPGYLATEKRPPGYEPHEVLVARARTALDRVHAEYEGADVLVVTHGGLIGAVERDGGLPWERMPNLGGRRVTHHGDRLSVGERLVLVDDDELTIPTQI